MLPRTSLTSHPLNDPDGGVHLVWPRITALLETIPPQGAVTAEQGPARGHRSGLCFVSPMVMGADSTGTWVMAIKVLLSGGLQASPGTAVGVLGSSRLLQPVRGVTH